MTDKKNDLTRIEDLGEFLHDFSADEEAESASTPTPEENSFEPTDFGEIEASEFNSEESFESTDFGTSDFAEEVS